VQAVVAVIAGSAFARFGYPPVLMAIAGVAVSTALAFRVLLGGLDERDQPTNIPVVTMSGAGAEAAGIRFNDNLTIR
jgi:hypothetical protein